MAFRAAWLLWTSTGASQTSSLTPCTASGRWRGAVMVSVGQLGVALRLTGGLLRSLSQELWDKAGRQRPNPILSLLPLTLTTRQKLSRL